MAGEDCEIITIQTEQRPVLEPTRPPAIVRRAVYGIQRCFHE